MMKYSEGNPIFIKRDVELANNRNNIKALKCNFYSMVYLPNHLVLLELGIYQKMVKSGF
jgi:hypothetical protein